MTEFKEVTKILVIKLRHIGDVLLTVPVFRALRETFPGAHISALVNSGTEEVLAGNPLIDDIIVYDRNIKKLPLHKRLAREISFLRAVRARGFDLAVDLTSGDRAALIAVASGARCRIAYDPEGGGFPGKRFAYTHLATKEVDPPHMVLQNLKVVGQFGISAGNTEVDFHIPDYARQYVSQVLKQHSISYSDIIVHFHPTSRWLFKCWNDKFMAGVINRLLDEKVTVVLTASPSKREMKKAGKIAALLKESPRLVNLCGKTTLKQLAAVSERADLFVGVDSAPMHIAAATGTPVIALFGPTEELCWGPWGGQHVILKKKLGCSICEKCDREGLEVRRCLQAISEEEVITAIRQKLKIRNEG